MKPQFRLFATALLLAVTALPAAAQDVPRPDERVTRVPVLGSVLDLRTENPIPQAAIVLRPEGDGDAIRRITGELGWFLFPDMPVGDYTVEVEALGYHAIHQPLTIRELSQLQLTVEMVPQALQLDPVVVVTERRTRLDIVGFNDRQRTGMGRFVTREDLDAHHALYVSDVLRTLPGVRVVPTTGGPLGNAVRLRRGCQPTVYVDGVRWMNLAHFTLDDLFMVNDIEAIEVYHGMLAPGQFWGGSCGSIVVWTRAGEPSTAEGSFWKRLAFALGFVAVSMFIAP